MARPVISFLVALLVVALAIFVASDAQPPKEIIDACDYVTVPQLCTSLAVKTGATSVQALTISSINESANMANEAKNTVANVKAPAITDQNLKCNLDECENSYGQVTQSLKKAGNDMQTGVDFHNVIGELRNPLNSVGHCNDVFSENPGMVSPVADVTSILKKLVSNSLALAVGLDVKQNH